jgi:hypothetical protein
MFGIHHLKIKNTNSDAGLKWTGISSSLIKTLKLKIAAQQ